MMAADIIARLPTLGERIDAINVLLDRIVDLEAQLQEARAQGIEQTCNAFCTCSDSIKASGCDCRASRIKRTLLTEGDDDAE